MPERRKVAEHGIDIQIIAIPPREAVIELVRHSFTPRVVEAIGLQPQRLALFAHMVQQVSMKRLIYPCGFGHLPAVRDAILQDLSLA